MTLHFYKIKEENGNGNGNEDQDANDEWWMRWAEHLNCCLLLFLFVVVLKRGWILNCLQFKLFTNEW